MKVEIKYYGTRGSTPVSGRPFEKYGGSTTCILFKINEHINIIDAGTGIRLAGNDLMKDGLCSGGQRLRLFFTHTHWDHIQGFPFFAPAYIPSNHIEVYGETKAITMKDTIGQILSEEKWDIQKTLSAQQNFMFFPVDTDFMAANHSYHELKGNEEYDFGDFKLKTLNMYHPNHTLGFRFEFEGGSFCFCTDVEHNHNMTKDITEFAQGADVFAYDSQYTKEQYDSGKHGWGHSTFNVGAQIACDAEVQEYHLVHHDPTHDDTMLASMEEASKKLFQNSLAVPEFHLVTF